MRVAIRGDFFAEEDAQDRERGSDDGDGGFDGGPDRHVFAVVGEVGLSELDDVDAFYYRADAGSGAQCVSCGLWVSVNEEAGHTINPCS